MIESRYICDICKGVISNIDTCVKITYRVDKSGEPYTVSSTITNDLCSECYGKLKSFFDNFREGKL